MNDYIVSRKDDIGFLNNFSIMETTDVILYKALNQFKVVDKMVFLCDETGIVTNIIGDRNIVEMFFNEGFNIGLSVFEKIEEFNVVKECINEETLVVLMRNSKEKFLKKWINMAFPIYKNGYIKNIVVLLIKHKLDINKCKILINLISFYETKNINENFSSIKDKILFFGSLMMNNKWNLTPKEIEVLYYLNNNLTSKEICNVMKISYNTIKTHLKNIYNKIEVENKEECKLFINNYFVKLLYNKY